MRIPITRYGWPQALLCPVASLILAAALAWLLPPARTPALLIGPILAIALLAFFRDPHRDIPQQTNILLAPADGKITDIQQLPSCEFLNTPAWRIGIFLSVLDVHINRAPCSGTVQYRKDRPGRCINALNWKKASSENQAATLGLNCPDHPAQKVIVKQITGAIARRIVCSVNPGDPLEQGQTYGMIKFGSRTELFFPVNPNAQIRVHTGQTVRAGSTICVQYKPSEQKNS